MSTNAAWMMTMLAACSGEPATDDAATHDGGHVRDSGVLMASDSGAGVDANRDDAGSSIDAAEPPPPSDAGPPSGELIFMADFETGNLSQWAYVERCGTNRIVVYSDSSLPADAPPPRSGHHAAHFHVLDGDTAPCTSSENPRAELETSESLFHPGDEMYEAWSVWIPSSHPSPGICGTTGCPNGTWFAIHEDYGAPWDGSPSVGWFMDFESSPNNFIMNRGQQYGWDTTWSTTLSTDRWVDFVVRTHFSNADDGTGFVEAWVDGAPITFGTCGCTRLYTQTMHSTQPSLGFYLTAYRAHGLFDVFDVYYDEVRIGTTREIVTPP